MLPRSFLAYVGDDSEFAEWLRNICVKHNWKLCECGQPADFIQYLRENQVPANSPDPSSSLRWIDDHLMPVVLDLDYQLPESLERVREIKSIHGTIPVIVIGKHISLAAFAVARMDGAEALFPKPLQDVQTFVETVQASFDRIACWHNTIQRCREAPRFGTQEPPLTAT